MEQPILVQCHLPAFPNRENSGGSGSSSASSNSSNSSSSSSSRRPYSSTQVSLPASYLDCPKNGSLSQDALDHLLMKAWAIVLRCYTASDHVCFGYEKEQLQHKRSRHTQAVAISISGDEAVSELRRRTLPLISISDSHLYNTIFTRQLESEDVEEFSSIPAIPSSCRVLLTIQEVFGLPSLTIHHRREEMSAGHITCLAQTLTQAIDQLLSPEDRTIADLDLLTPRDRTRIEKWNAVLPPTRDLCIHEIVEQQCSRQPSKEAICAWDGSFSFEQLDVLSSRLGAYLQKQGVGPETMVPLCFEKTKWYTIAVYSVLKAGGAFVPLDPSHPESRLRSLIDKVDAKVVLTSPAQQSKLVTATSKPVIAVDEDLISHCSPRTLARTVQPQNAAYVIFTSGSTGEPKGTVLEHRAFASAYLPHSEILHVNGDNRYLQFAAHTFDASLVEILSVLMQGGTICIPSDQSRINDLAGAINDLGVTSMSLTPSVIEFLSPAMIPRVRQICLAGETMSTHQRDTWCHLSLINGFGPTEASICSAGNPHVTQFSDVRDIGLPCACRCWIVDPADHDRLMPVGAVGEMLLEGPTLARDYLSNPTKTAEAFITAPRWASSSTDSNGNLRRFYKSGDLVRYHSPAGSLTYIGRKDTQVKLHGQRVELGEIESALTADSDVLLALVHVAKSGYAAGKVVCVLCFDGAVNDDAKVLLLEPAAVETGVAELRQRVAKVLPTYMVPGVWLPVQSLPFLASGKLDRKRVAAWLEGMDQDPLFDAAGGGTEMIDAPDNETEAALAAAWSRVLNIPLTRLKMTESFLKLGGDSLSAMTCMGLCKKAGVGVSVQDVLRSASIRDLATRAVAIEETKQYEEVMEREFELSPIQRLHGIVRKEEQGWFNQSVQTRVRSPVGEAVLRGAIEALVKRHGMLRARFSKTGPDGSMRQRITADVASSFRLRHHEAFDKLDVEEIVEQSQQSINCFSGPLLSVDLVDVHGESAGQVLSLVAHHLVVDIVSFRLILSDLEELLLASPDKPVAVAAPSIPFQLWSDAQASRARLDTSELPPSPPNNLVFWALDTPPTYGDISLSTFEISSAATKALLTGIHGPLNTETVDLLLACLLQSFRQTFPRGPDPVVHNEGHGREPWDAGVDVSRTVGWFTTLYPIWLPHLAAGADVIDAVIGVKDARRAAADNGRVDFARRMLAGDGQDVPMEMSFNYLGQNRDLQSEKGLFSLADTMVGETRVGGGGADFGKDTPRFAVFEISAAVIDGRLRWTFSYPRGVGHRNEVGQWIEMCRELLEVLPAKLQGLQSRRTGADFPLLKIGALDLPRIEQELEGYGVKGLHEVEDMLPCTRMQTGILLARIRNPALYAVRLDFRALGLGSAQETVRAVTSAWGRVVARHGMLRSLFVERLTPGTVFGQVVLNEERAEQPVLLTCEEAEEVDHALAGLGELPGHLAHRFTICTVARTVDVVCRLEINHAAMDGSSISLLLRDMKEACTRPAALDAAPRPVFADFARHLSRQPADHGVAFWSGYLRDAMACALPLLPDGDDLAGRKTLNTRRLSFPHADALAAFCETHAVTPSTIFSGAWALLLSSLLGSSDVSFAYTSSLRDAPVPGIQDVVGPVMNLNVCRVQMADSAAGVAEVLRGVQEDFGRALPFRACALVDVLHAMGRGGEALFNTGVSYRKLPAMSRKEERVRFVPRGLIHDPAETAVFVNVEAGEEGTGVELNWWGECLNGAQAEGVGMAFLEMIEGIVLRGGSVAELRRVGDDARALFGDSRADAWAKAGAKREPCLLPLAGSAETEEVRRVDLAVRAPAKLLQFCKENDVEAALVFRFVWAVVLRLYSGSAETCFGVLEGASLRMCGLNARDDMSIFEALRELKDTKEAGATIPAIQAAGTEMPFNTIVCSKGGFDTDTVTNLLNTTSTAAILVSEPLTRSIGRMTLHHSAALSNHYISALTDCFLHILSQIPFESLGAIGDLNFVDDNTCRQYTLQSSPMPARDPRCAHEIIQQEALARPKAPAISAWDGEVNYAELMRLATHTARKLKGYGVGPNVFVACLFDKSKWAVVSQLAVMLAGGAFVSLDPAHAEARLRTLVQQCGAPVVLCSAGRLEVAKEICEVAFAVELERVEGAPAPSEHRKMQTKITDAAYAVFTSGTTGTPKASVIEHAALTTSAKQWAAPLGFSQESRVFQFSAFTFDVSVMDVFFTLLNGGCVCMPSETQRMNDLADTINRSGATLMASVPSLFATIDPAKVPTLRYLVPGGEKMTPAFMEMWQDRHLVNAYGPSETTVVATLSLKADGSGALINTDSADIGKPHCGRAWVVDPSNSKLLPRGAVGELVMEGPNVGRGYLNNEEKTAQAFIRNPVWARDARLREIFARDSQVGGERMYRTGDLVRFTASGTLTFLTRNDTQVKLNGQRVELEEIEHHCASLAGGHVLVDIVKPKEKTVAAGLAAFFVSATESGERSGHLLLPMTKARTAVVDHIRAQLPHLVPSYMVPTFYFPVSHLPRSVSAKLDRRALQIMAASMSKEEMRPYSSTASASSDLPKTGLEPRLRALWEKVMRLEPGSVSDDDTFFGLGGDSFAAMTLVSAAQVDGLSLTVRDIFSNPSLTGMCAACKSKDASQVSGAAMLEPFSLIPVVVPREEVLADSAAVCGVAVDSIQDIYPCSPVQAGLITSSSAKPGAYVLRSIYRLSPQLDLSRFCQAWQRTVADLAILRTRIVHLGDAGFCQVVLRETPIEWKRKDAVPGHADAVPALPMSEGDALTEYAICETEEERFFAWSLHHATYDGWSIGLVLEKVQEHYLQLSAADGMQTVPYALFVDYLAKQNPTASDDFWRAQFDGFQSPAFPKIVDTSRAVEAGSRQQSSVDLSILNNTEVTLAVQIKGAWALAIADVSESSDICFGETLMARNIDLSGITKIAGPTLTTVPTRVQVDKHLSIATYLQNINQKNVDVIPHQHRGVQNIRRLTPSASAACEFHNLLVVQAEDQELEPSIWEFDDLQAGEGFFTYPLVVECKIAGTKVKTTAHHDSHVISASQVQNLVERFQFILSQLAEMPVGSKHTIDRIDFVGPTDKAQILEWNSGRIAPVEKTIHDLVYQQRAFQPDADAICAWDDTLTYRELCKHASAFAHHLVSLGLGKEMFVPVCMDKSAWVIVALLGVLAAGGAYVPLDPAHPPSRHEEIITDVGAAFVICLPKYAHRFFGKVDAVLEVDRDVLRKMQVPGKPPVRRSASNNMAYALFTSGSTGKPKGIVTEHASFVSSVSAFGPVIHLERGTRAFQFASLTFDAALKETWGTLIFGGTICIPSEEDRLNDVAGAMAALNIDWAFCTPSVASVIEPSSVPSLKTLVCGGEMITAEIIKKWTPHVEVINGYGPTETSVFATLAAISLTSEPSCIGRPIRSTCAWIIDPENHDRLLPVGSVGELALSGRALAREYLNNPEKTNAEFIHNPRWAAAFPNTTANRIYKTGDLVRYCPDGAIECLGRKDHQVKLHGQRMELGEIESRLSQMDSIRHALVLLPKKGLVKGRLVAILTVNAGDKSLHASSSCRIIDRKAMNAARLPEVTGSLEKQLPNYMVPQTWVVMESLPMLVSGKIDRKQITNWIDEISKDDYERVMDDYDDMKRGKMFEVDAVAEEAVASPVEVLREVCAQVLNLDHSEVNVQRSFLSLGGDSITGMAVVAKARKQGLQVRLQDIIKTQSVAELAERSKFTDQAKANQVSRPRAMSGAAFSMSPIQDLYFQHALNGYKGESRFNQSMTVRLSRRVSSGDVQRAVENVVLRHGMLRARFSMEADGLWRQRITKHVEASYSFRHHTTNDKESIKIKMGQSQRALDPEHGPIVAVDMFDAPREDPVLFLVANHLCIDMVSWRVILSELEEFLTTGKLASEAPLSFQAWLGSQSPGTNSISKSHSLDSPLNASYWGVNQIENTYGQAKTRGFSLDQSFTTALLDGLQSLPLIDPLDLFLAATSHSFAETFAGVSQPTIYNESHGRQSCAQDISETVGWFTTVAPLQFQRYSNVIESAKLVKELRQNPKRTSVSSSQNGPMEILFNYLGTVQQLERSDSLFQHYGEAFTGDGLTEYGDMGTRTVRFALFEISIIVLKGELRVAFTYNKNLKHQDKIERWTSNFDKTLREALPEIAKLAKDVSSVSFPLLPASPRELQQLIERTLPRMGVKSMDLEDIYPVAPVQEGILFSQLRDPSTYLFNASFKITDNRANTLVNTQDLAAAWQKVIDRHPILRTIFVESNYKNGTFDQVVLRKVIAPVSSIVCNDELSVQNSLSMTDVNKQRSPEMPHHLTICQVASSGEVHIKIEINHALIDGASISIILRDFSSLYCDLSMPTVPGPDYSRFVQYVANHLSPGSLQYWNGHLHAMQPCHVPTAQDLTKTRRLNSLKVAFHRFDELQDLCRQESITFASLVFSVWAAVLAALTGQDDVCFGYLSAGRDVPVADIQDAVGVFINMLCCRVKVSSCKNYSDLFRRVQEDFLEAIPHQATSLATIQNALGMDGQMLFNSTLSIQKQAPSDVANAGALSFAMKMVHDPSEYPITINVVTAKGHEGIMLRYWSDKIADSQAHGIAAAITQTFEKALQGTKSPVASTGALVNSLSQSRTPMPSFNPVPQMPTPPTSPLLASIRDMDSLHRLIDERVNAALSKKQDTSLLHSPWDRSKSGASKQTLPPHWLTPPMSEDEGDEPTSFPNIAQTTEQLPMEVSIDPFAIYRTKLLNIWASILEVETTAIKATDSFLRYGGDSIKAMKLASAAREQEMALRVSDIFRAPVFDDMLGIIASNSEQPVSSKPIPTSTAASSVQSLVSTLPAITPAEPQPRSSRRSRARSMYESVQIDDEFLQKSICPLIGTFKGAVADVVPVTDFQSFSLTGQQFKSRWMLNYFYFEGQGSLDLRRLREACKRVLDAFDILRSVFVCAEGQFYQVVLKKMKVDLGVHETEMELDDFVADLQQRDRDTLLIPGQPFVAFAVVRKAGTDLHRILVRMSHAQYDGVCLWKLLDALKQGYEGGTLPKTSSFSSHLRLISSLVTRDHYTHFSTLLQGSKMPEIIRRQGPNTYSHVGSATNVSTTVDISMGSKGSTVTAAMIVQAAWAIVLAKISAQPDVVFGLTISGRNAPVPGIETAVGPCVNVIPVRVGFGAQWTGLDLLRSIQDQSVAAMPFESLGFREIIQHCTDWPNWTYFTTSVFHQNVSYEGSISLDEQPYRVGGAGVIDNLSDLTLFSTPLPTENKYHFSLHYSEKGPIGAAFATRVLNMAVEAINSLTSSPNATLPSPMTLTSLPAQQVDDVPQTASKVQECLDAKSVQSLMIHSPALTRAWSQVLTSDKARSGRLGSGNYGLQSGFFELGGDLLDLGKVAYILHRANYSVTLEDLLERPTFIGQLAAMDLSNSNESTEPAEEVGAVKGIRRVTRSSASSRPSSHTKGTFNPAEASNLPMPSFSNASVRSSSRTSRHTKSHAETPTELMPPRPSYMQQSEGSSNGDTEVSVAPRRVQRSWSRFGLRTRESTRSVDQPPVPPLPRSRGGEA